ncbi:hypothetical protein ACFX2I_038086 [Malus domestica]
MRMNKNYNQVVLETQGHWKIQKRLAASDLGYCVRLLIPIDSFRNHVLPYLGDKFVKRLESEAGSRSRRHQWKQTLQLHARPPFACDPRNLITRAFKFCRVRVPIHGRVRDLIGQLTLQEKIGLLVNNVIAVPRLGIQGY